jgi:hypothetical protein
METPIGPLQKQGLIDFAMKLSKGSRGENNYKIETFEQWRTCFWEFLEIFFHYSSERGNLESEMSFSSSAGMNWFCKIDVCRQYELEISNIFSAIEPDEFCRRKGTMS